MSKVEGAVPLLDGVKSNMPGQETEQKCLVCAGSTVECGLRFRCTYTPNASLCTENRHLGAARYSYWYVRLNLLQRK
jgi:hypothetical protein